MLLCFEKKKNLILFLLKKQSQFFVFGFFFSPNFHCELVISIYSCLKTRAEKALDTIWQKKKRDRLKILQNDNIKKTNHSPIRVKGRKL